MLRVPISFANRVTDWKSLSWFHVLLTTYGSWLPGDKRGFRTRKHTYHCEGDYKDPPAKGRYEELYEMNRDRLTQPSVILTPYWRELVGSSIIEHYASINSYLLCIAVSKCHIHLLAKLQKEEARTQSGKAKLHTWHALNQNGWKQKLWATRSREEEIRHPNHHRNAMLYILRHDNQGAWTWKDPEQNVIAQGT